MVFHISNPNNYTSYKVCALTQAAHYLNIRCNGNVLNIRYFFP